MDSITHIALGACMGEAFAGKQLGKKAMLWGALAQSIPDIDFIASFWMDASSNLLAHRGFTHSFLFCLVITPLLSLLAEHWHKPHNISLPRWNFFFGAVIFIHIFIDAFNNYGVGWFEPFSHYRISFNSIYVADPFFSMVPLLAFVLLLFIHSTQKVRRIYWRLGLLIPALYLSLCLINKLRVDQFVKKELQKNGVVHHGYFSTPAPLQNWLWYIVVQNKSGYFISFHSLFDRKEMPLQFEYFPKNDSLLAPVKDHEDLYKLIRFSKGFYTVEKWHDTLVFNDLRFGQVTGWQHPKGKFVFHYFLQHPGENELVVQRGRFMGWNRETAASLLKRIGGN